MIGPGTGVLAYLACGTTDMRKGIEGLAALSQDVLRQKATGWAVFAFRGKRGDRLKLLHWVSDWNAALKAMIAHLQAENMRVQADIGSISATLRAHEALVQALQIQIARLKKQKFGASSERTLREIEQLELALEHLEIAGAAAISTIAPDDDAELSAEEQAAMPSTPRRRKPLVTVATPRERIVLDPGDDCPECGTLRLIGEDVSEILELISARLKVIETSRLKKSCVRRVNDPPDRSLSLLTCEKITQPPAPSRRSAGKLSPGQFPDPPYSA